MKDVIIDTLLDIVKLVPFLFIAFLLIELIEHKLSKKTEKLVSKAGKLGPLFGSLFGIIPQCGFSVLATNLYITRIVSLGTLISIYLATSDEMLPILISEKAPVKTVLIILLIKFLVGLIAGIIIDFIISKTHKEEKHHEHIHDLCEHEHCNCEEGIIKSSIIHTLKILFFILLITFILNAAFYYKGEEYIKNLLSKTGFITPFITSLIGLIPNCGASVVITELYVNNILSLGSTMAGLLTGSGVAILVLLKSNKNIKENIKIISIIYLIGSLIGLLINFIY